VNRIGEATTFRIPSPDDANGWVPARVFAHALDEWIAALEQTVSDLEIKHGTVVWVLTGLTIGSATAELTPEWDSVGGELAAKESQSRVIFAASRFQQSGDFGNGISAKAAAHLGNSLRAVCEAGIGHVEIVHGNTRLELPTTAFEPAARSRSMKQLGSLEGEIVALSFAKVAVLTIRVRLYNNLVPCYFDQDRWLEAAKAGLLRRVVVSGIITYRENGEPSSMSDLDAIHVFPDDSELPQPIDLLGITPDFTGGLPAEVWLARQRE
jgi:hypothetical protein